MNDRQRVCKLALQERLPLQKYCTHVPARPGEVFDFEPKGYVLKRVIFHGVQVWELSWGCQSALCVTCGFRARPAKVYFVRTVLELESCGLNSCDFGAGLPKRAPCKRLRCNEARNVKCTPIDNLRLSSELLKPLQRADDPKQK